MRNVLMCFVFIATATFANAQDTITKTKYLSLATGIHQAVEENIVGLRHQGVLWKVGYGKERIGLNKQAYNFHFAFSRPKNKLEDFTNSVYAQLAARYRYEFNVTNSNALRLFIGPYAAVEYNVSMYANWDDSHVYHGNHASVGAGATALYRLRQGDAQPDVLIASIELPVVAALSRPDLYRLYKIDDVSFDGIVYSLHENLKFGSLNVVRYVNASLEYKSQLTPRRQYAVGYNLSVSRMKHPDSNALRLLQHSVTFKRYFR